MKHYFFYSLLFSMPMMFSQELPLKGEALCREMTEQLTIVHYKRFHRKEFEFIKKRVDLLGKEVDKLFCNTEKSLNSIDSTAILQEWLQYYTGRCFFLRAAFKRDLPASHRELSSEILLLEDKIEGIARSLNNCSEDALG